MRSWHLLNMALLKVEQGHFETAILIIHNFFVFFTATGVKNHYIKYPHHSNAVYSDAAVKGFIFRPNSAIANGTTKVFMSSVSPASR